MITAHIGVSTIDIILNILQIHDLPIKQQRTVWSRSSAELKCEKWRNV